MARLLLFIALLLSIISNYSSATYCVCIDGAGETALQTDIDYACGAGADCSAIRQSGACYQPNTVKSHCDYAVNSYYQKMGQVSGSCNFSGTATVTNTLPSTVVSGCTYPASSSQVSAATPTSSTSGTNSSTTGSAATPTSSTSGTNSSTTGSTTGSTSPFSGFAPTGTDATISPSGGQSFTYNVNSLSATLVVTIFISGLLFVLWA